MYKIFGIIAMLTLLLTGCGAPNPKPIQTANISGTWYMGGPYNKGMPCKILQSGNELVFVNEKGGTSNGFILSSSQVIATDWNGLKGQLDSSKKQINWANNTWWYKK